MQTVEFLRIQLWDFKAEASGQMAISALMILTALYLLRRQK